MTLEPYERDHAIVSAEKAKIAKKETLINAGEEVASARNKD